MAQVRNNPHSRLNRCSAWLNGALLHVQKADSVQPAHPNNVSTFPFQMYDSRDTLLMQM